MKNCIKGATYTILIGILVSNSACRGKKADIIPSYKLKAGQVLLYEGSSEYESKNRNRPEVFIRKSEIWVVGQNKDGSWRLICRNESKPPKDINVTAIDLYANGRIETKHPNPRDVARDCFIILPSTPELFKKSWETRDKDEKHTYTFDRQSKPHKGRWIFQETSTSKEAEIYGVNRSSLVHFNAKLGLVEKIESTFSQTYGITGGATGVMELKSINTVDPNFLNQLSSDTEIYFRALQSYRNILSTLAEYPDSIDERLAEAKDVLLSVQIKNPAIKEQIENHLKNYEKNIDYRKKRAEEQIEVLNKPSPDWETVDFKGNTYSNETLRGKVVVLDFWYRGCGWCIRAMPQIKEVADYFANQPVVVLGMNIDGKAEDAEFVIEKMALNYPNLRAEDIPEKFEVQGYPTLIVIDQNGIVRDFHVGYSTDLRDNVIKSIESLLETKTMDTQMNEMEGYKK